MILIDIEKKYFSAGNESGQIPVIADFRLKVNRHEFVCLVGPSGCGKTTLLNLIAGLDRNFDGTITLGRESGETGIGYVFQNPRLLPWRTVRENIELALTDSNKTSLIHDMLEIMQLTRFQHIYPERLSLGMSRRVAIIRAFAVNPEVLLLDEPFVSLDRASATQVRQLLLKLWEQRPHTVLFVTHDLREAIALADRIVFLSSAPMQAKLDVAVPIPRDQRDDERLIEHFRHQLLQDYPGLI